MKKITVIQALSLARSGKLDGSAPEIPVQDYEEVLGPLNNTEVPLILTVIGYFGPISPHSKEAVNGVGEALQKLHEKIDNIALAEYSKTLPADHRITVRWHEGCWVVVGTPSERVRRATYRPAMN